MSRFAGAFALACLISCAPAGPRLPSNVVSGFVHEEMRHARTKHVELYYPESRREAALRMIHRLDYCVERLRALPRHPANADKPVLAYMTTANFNNAFAYPSIAGYPRQIVVPANMSLELFGWFNLGLSEIGEVSCHEALHYVHMEQTHGGWAFVNWLLGDVFSPNSTFEPWFTEGLATYYEARLEHAVGRPNSPLWVGAAEAGLSSEGGLTASDLNASNRSMNPWGAHYLVGSYFVDWLAKRYGEEKLWELIDVQGSSLFSPLWVSLRFKQVYGLSLDALIDQANKELAPKLAPRPRPPDQTVLARDVGYFARLAPLDNGAIAALTSSVDQVDQLTVYEPDGKVRFQVGVTPFRPPRPYVSADPALTTGLSYTEFSPSGGKAPSLYAVIDDVGEDGNSTSTLVRFDANTGEYRQHWNGFVAVGGSVSSDGRSYVMAEIDRGITSLVRVDLLSGNRQRLYTFSEGATVVNPRLSPDGKKISFVRWGGDSFDLAYLDETGKVQALTQDGVFDYFPSWLDDRTLVFVRSEEGRAQVNLIDVQTRQVAQVSHAPFIAAEPIVAAPGKVAFLNREGWSWSLDSIEVSAASVAGGTPSAHVVVAEKPQPAPTAPALLSDEKYNPLDNLLVPNLRGVIALPWFAQGRGDVLRLGLYAGLMLKGSDRLGFHNYAINASYLSGLSGPDLSLSYGNMQLAPWYLEAEVFRQFSGARLAGNDTQIVDFSETVDSGVILSASRSFWTTPVSMSLHAFERTRQPFLGETTPPTRFVGPSFSTGYGAFESSSYAGARRGFSVSMDLSGYFEPVSSVTMADLRLGASAALPVPGNTLHSLRLSARLRGLPGAPNDLLRVGGLPLGIGIFGSGESTADAPGGYILPARISFDEYLRGYEDFTLVTNGAALLGARYRLPLPIDRGWASTFYLFPSFFIRGVDLEAYWDSALTADRSWHRAAGGAVWFKTVFGSAVPVSLVYQFAFRFDDGLAPYHQIAVVLE